MVSLAVPCPSTDPIRGMKDRIPRYLLGTWVSYLTTPGNKLPFWHGWKETVYHLPDWTDSHELHNYMLQLCGFHVVIFYFMGIYYVPYLGK